MNMPPVPDAFAHIYPMQGHECHYDACFTPSTQPTGGPYHFPVFTLEQMESYAIAAMELNKHE